VAPAARYAWLSITPEPERELPTAIAALRAGGAPDPGAVEAERARVERLVTGARRRAWTAYLAEARDMALAAEPGEAREIALEVIENHDNLKLGLPGGTA
jgi:PhoPQ-activated pathogenicity-related protein